MLYTPCHGAVRWPRAGDQRRKPFRCLVGGKSVTEKDTVLLCSSCCNKHHGGGLNNRPFSLPVLGAGSLRFRGQHGGVLGEALLVCRQPRSSCGWMAERQCFRLFLFNKGTNPLRGLPSHDLISICLKAPPLQIHPIGD